MVALEADAVELEVAAFVVAALELNLKMIKLFPLINVSTHFSRKIFDLF